jgi:hypothetical protein
MGENVVVSTRVCREREREELLARSEEAQGE